MDGRKVLDIAQDSGPLATLAMMVAHVCVEPNDVTFYITEGRSRVYVEIEIPAGSRGKVIGREGAMINSIRNVFYSGLKTGDPRYDISLVEDDPTTRREGREWGSEE